MSGIDPQSTYSGTKEVAERLQFDVARLETYLREKIEGFAGPVALRQFKGGQSNPTYLVARRHGNTCFAASRPANCCRRHMPSIANIA